MPASSGGFSPARGMELAFWSLQADSVDLSEAGKAL